MITSCPGTACASESFSRTSPFTNVNRRSRKNGRRGSPPYRSVSNTVTSYPRSSSNGTRQVPMYPAPPVTRIRIGSEHSFVMCDGVTDPILQRGELKLRVRRPEYRVVENLDGCAVRLGRVVCEVDVVV